MDIISVNNDNVDTEHICCAITDKKGECCVSSKKAWLKERYDDGLVFKKLNARGKVFIEYIPAENAWCPIIAENYMFINCFWVSGQFKGQGYANKLLEGCIDDARSKGKNGLVILSSKKKIPFLSDPKYLKYKGFEQCDSAEPYYELLYLPFELGNEKPRFKECCKKGVIDNQGMVLYYSNQCPHTEKYVKIIHDIAKQQDQSLKVLKLNTTSEAQSAPAPFTTYSLFYNGRFVTNEILSEKKFEQFLNDKDL
ncbi:MAG: GNAT family N-acetyltransferase [Firmicutes bacterium HGW-Firmicutes-1]|jgi:predicted GNAT family acetyltransferase|nr:MAG: GNAT family N-acetyltransferase [Firmicutes bacterium HGW-Firmicutes-1]